MINKQSLWFVTLFSLIVILGIYYFSTGETNMALKSSLNHSSKVSKTDKFEDNISVLKVTDDEATVSKIDELHDVLLDSTSTIEQKNNAYDELEVISSSKTKENEISELIKKAFNYKNFVKINNDQVNVVISSDVHNNEIANNIIKKVQEIYKDSKYVTVKFDTK